MTLHQIARARWRVAAILSIAVVTIYFGFILLIAFDKPLMGMLLMPGLSLGIAVGALVIVASWLATLVYVLWANGRYEKMLRDHAGDRP